MKKACLQIFCLIVSISCAAQVSTKALSTEKYIELARPCGGMDSVLSKKGGWKKVEDDVVFPDKTFPRSQYSQVNKRIDKMFAMMKETITDFTATQGEWYRGMRGDSWGGNGPVPFQFRSLYFNYYCNDNVNKVLLGDETANWIEIYSNSWGWLCEKIDDWDINNDGKLIALFTLPPKVGTWKGKTVYAPPARRALDTARAIVIGHNGKLPWHSLTRKQYLTGLKNMYLQNKRKSLDAIHTNPQKLPDAELKKIEDKISRSYDEDLKYIDDYLLANSQTDLDKPAIIDPKFNALKFRGVFGTEDKGGTRVIAFSLKYFNDSLPRYVPQFMVVYWRWEGGPVAQIFKKQFEENFPLKMLTEMIDN